MSRKLTTKQVYLAKNLFTLGSTPTFVGKYLGISRQSASDIKHGKTWKDVKTPSRGDLIAKIEQPRVYHCSY